MVQQEHYENYLNIKDKLGIIISNSHNMSPKELFSGAFMRRYELSDGYKKRRVRLVPSKHSTTVMQEGRSAFAPQVPIFCKESILKKSVVDDIAKSLDIHSVMAAKLMQNDSYISLTDAPVECYLYDVYDFLATCGNRYNLDINIEGDIFVVTLLHKHLAPTKITKESMYSDLKNNDNFSRDVKDALVEGISILNDVK